MEWPEQYKFDNSLDVELEKLRQKMTESRNRLSFRTTRHSRVAWAEGEQPATSECMFAFANPRWEIVTSFVSGITYYVTVQCRSLVPLNLFF